MAWSREEKREGRTYAKTIAFDESSFSFDITASERNVVIDAFVAVNLISS